MPLILTLIIDEGLQLFFSELRKKHFPPERNYLDAHLTLFHNLPNNEPAIITTLESVCAEYRPYIMHSTGLVSIGNGVAYKIDSSELQTMHKYLQQQWQRWLIPQDKQKLWPHITIQNKTDADTANALIKHLSVDFKPFDVKALGFNLWEYKGGPWKFVESYLFDH